MKRKTLLIACLFGLGSVQALAVSKLPPQIPVHAGSGRVTLDLRPLLAETNDVEITRVSVCRRVGSHCQETLWRIGCCSTKRPAWHDATPRSGKERSHER